MTALANDFQQIAWVRPAYKVAIRAFSSKRIGQRQATHDMPAAHLKGGIGSKGDFHQRFSLGV